jgi:hypothetical protein
VLRRELRQSKRAAYASGTRKNLKVQWETFLLFCTHFQLQALPASLDTVCLYAQFLVRSFASVDSVKNYVSGVKLLHAYCELEFPHTGAFELRLAFRGLAREHPHVVRQVLPITPAILLQVRQQLDFGCPRDSTIWCLFLFAFFLMLRKSNLVVTIKSDTENQLRRSDVIVGHDQLLVNIRWSKTIQFGNRILTLPLLAIPGSCLCPVQSYKRMIELVPASGESLAFVLPSKKGVVPVTYSQLQTTLRKVLLSIGLDPGEYASHSFRRGGATWAFKAKVPPNLIQCHGDWKSDAYKRYLKFDLQDK